MLIKKQYLNNQPTYNMDKNEAIYRHVWGVEHVWAFVQMKRFGALLQLDMFCSSVTSMWTRFGESDTFGGKDTFLSVTYLQ